VQLPTCTFHRTARLRCSNQKRIRNQLKEPHRSFSTPAGTKEEDRVIAGLGDGAGDEVLQLAAQLKRRRISKIVSGELCGRNRYRFGSPVIGVRGGPEGGVDECRVAEPAPKHGLCLARHGHRCHHSGGGFPFRWAWDFQVGNSVKGFRRLWTTGDAAAACGAALELERRDAAAVVERRGAALGPGVGASPRRAAAPGLDWSAFPPMNEYVRLNKHSDLKLTVFGFRS
jgi:hypothetical protein